MRPKLRAIDVYNGTQVRTGVDSASPHRLVQMLFDGLLTRIDQARGAMQRGETALKGEKIGAAITIVEGLHANLDLRDGAAIAQNLSDLYTYMSRSLVRANAENNVDLLDETAALVREVKAGWDAIEMPLTPDQKVASS